MLTSSSLEMARCVVALRQEDVVISTTSEWLVQGNGGTQELLLDRTETVETGLELKVVVAV
jgi:hypothetical protein